MLYRKKFSVCDIRYSFSQWLVSLPCIINLKYERERECVYKYIEHQDIFDGLFWIHFWWFTSSFLLLFHWARQIDRRFTQTFAHSFSHSICSLTTTFYGFWLQMEKIHWYRIYLNVMLREPMNRISHLIVCVCVTFVSSTSFRCECQKFYLRNVWLFLFFFPNMVYEYNIFLYWVWLEFDLVIHSNGRGGKNDDDDMHFGIWSNCDTHTYTKARIICYKVKTTNRHGQKKNNISFYSPGQSPYFVWAYWSSIDWKCVFMAQKILWIDGNTHTGSEMVYGSISVIELEFFMPLIKYPLIHFKQTWQINVTLSLCWWPPSSSSPLPPKRSNPTQFDWKLSHIIRVSIVIQLI